MSDFSRIPVTIVGASRGLAETFYRLGAQVLVVARGQRGLDDVARDLPEVTVLACDASAAGAPERVFAVQVPRILILCGGDVPQCRPFHGRWCPSDPNACIVPPDATPLRESWLGEFAHQG